MKRIFIHGLLWSVALGMGFRLANGAAATEGEVIARVHAAGAAARAADSGGSLFKEVWALPVANQLRGEVVQKLTRAFATHLQRKGGGGAPTAANMLRPLLADLESAEWVAEVIDRGGGGYETSLAIRLDPDRLQHWHKGWTDLLAQFQVANGKLTTFSTNAWFGVDWIEGQTTGSDRSLFQSLNRGQVPTGLPAKAWFRLEGDLARWRPWLKIDSIHNLPRVDLTVTGHNEYLRTQGQLTFPEPAVSKVETWQIPMETLRDPLISFTAWQGIASWLQSRSWIQELNLDQVPNQLFLWGLAQTAFQIQAAVPVADGRKAFEQIERKWVPEANQALANHAIGQIRSSTNNSRLNWGGLPILVPYLEPLKDHGQDFLHAGIFPVNPPSTPPPPELFEQLTRSKNLVYYDWEITQARLDQVRPILPILSVLMTVTPMSTNSVSSKWLDAVEPRLGNCVTEVAVENPQRLKLSRTSHLGLSALELLTLANWVEGTNFPMTHLDLQFRPIMRATHSKPKK